MKIKQFFIYSLIYIGVVAVAAFTQESGSYTLNIFGFELNLPIALWFALAVGIYAILAILHLIFNSISYYSARRAINKDMKTYEALSKEVLLGLETNKEFKTDYFKDACEITQTLSPWNFGAINISNENLKNIVEDIKKIDSGEVIELKKYKLPRTNKLYIKNELNKLKADPLYAREILKQKEPIEILNDEAYKTLLENDTFLEIKKHGVPEKIDQINIILNRFVNSKIEISKDDLFELINNKNFTEENFLDLAKKLEKSFEPNVYKAIFERLKNENSNANEAYLYVLYEIGMLDELREQINSSDSGEHEKFELLLFLRDNGKKVPASLVI